MRLSHSVSALSERLSELEHTVQSRMTTPVTEESVTNVEVWSTIEQALMSEMGKVKNEHAQAMTRFDICEKLHENQKSQERQLTGLRSFAQHVEQFLDQLGGGATAPNDSRQIPRLEGDRASVPQGYVLGASASSSMRPSSYLQTPRPPTIPAPPVPCGNTPASGENTSPWVSATHFSTVRSEVRSGAIRINISNPEQLSAGDTAILRNQEAKKVRDIGSLISETPIQHDYEVGAEARSLPPTEQLEEVDGRLAVTEKLQKRAREIP